MNPNEPQSNPPQPVEQPNNIPQPIPQPSPPVQPPASELPPLVTPVATGTTPLPAAPAPKSHKKLIVIISIIAGLLLIGVAVALYFVFTTVTKQDYAAAAQQYSKVTTANSQFVQSASLVSSSSTWNSNEQFATNVKKVETAMAAVQTENNTLGDLKAVRIGEGASLYKTFDEKLTAYQEYSKGILTSVKSLQPAMATCSSVSDAKDVATRVSALKACSTALNGVGDLPDPAFKSFVDSLKTGYADYATTYESISALTNPYGSQYEQYKTLRDKMYATQGVISDAGKQFSAALNKKEDELSVKDSAKALADYLNKQQS